MHVDPSAHPGDDLIPVCIAQARAGSEEALNRLFVHCRNYLLRIAEEEMDSTLQVREDPSDVVQQTCLEASRDFVQFRGQTEAELLGWLREILRHNLANAVRYNNAAMRRISREVSLDDSGKDGPLKQILASEELSPGSHLQRQERELQLLVALGRLSEDHRKVICWQHLEHCSFEEIGRRLGRTAGAARHLWLRAVEKLKQELDNDG
jgi:RNA polymerase sigma-70 factor (ECF subfamily)